MAPRARGSSKKKRRGADFDDELDNAMTPREVIELILAEKPSSNQTRKALKKWAELVEERHEQDLDAELEAYGD